MRFILAAFALATIAGALPAQQVTPPAGRPDSAGPRDTSAASQMGIRASFGPTLADTSPLGLQLSGGHAAPVRSRVRRETATACSPIRCG